MSNATANADDARAAKITLRCPRCNKSSRRVTAGTVATSVFDYACWNPDCFTGWRVIVRPLRASREAVVRQVEWTEIKTCGPRAAARLEG